ncbi:MAG: FtsX-like permease family protein [Acidimicrobiales bacterium]|jgi:putative ABC transport system permease protein|nr:FtsX-like permease family protein [Acidimicrobiales bacterium]
MLHVTLKGLLAHKLRFAMTALAVVLGVSLMTGTMVLGDTVTRTFDDLFTEVNAGTDAVVRSSSVVTGGPAGDQRATVSTDLLDDVAAVPGVAAAEGVTMGYAQIVDRSGDALGNPGQGAPTYGMSWPAVEALNPFTLTDGRAPTAPGEVVIDKASAGTTGYVVGDPLTVLTAHGPQEVTLVGIARFGSADSPAGATIAAFEGSVAQELVGTTGQVSEIDVVAADDVGQEELVRRLSIALPDDVEAITGDAATEEQRSGVQDGLSFFTTFLLIFAGVALFVGAFIISNTFAIVVAQRTRELALLRAVGASRRQVRAAVLGEAAVLGLVASLVGVGVGVGVALGLKGLFGALGFDIPATGLVVEPSTVAVAVGVGLAVTLVASLLPARRASSVPPIAALRTVAHEDGALSATRIGSGVAIAGLGIASLLVGLFGDPSNPGLLVGLGTAALFLGVAVLGPVLAGPVSRLLGAPLPTLRGVPGRLARDNASRSPRRTASSAAALMIGVGVAVFFAVFAASATASIDKTIDDSFVGDLVVDSGAFGFGGLDPELARQLVALPEVEVATGLRFTTAEVDGSADLLPALDVDAATRLFDIGVRDGVAVIGDGELAVSSGYADSHGLAVGDPLEVRFPDTGARTLTVATVYDNSDLAGDYFVDLSTFESAVTEQLDAQIWLGVADGVDPGQARASVEAVADPYPTASVQDLTEFKEAQAAPINQLLTLVFALLSLAVLIATLGIANTLGLSVVERTRELGLLRAVGATRRQIGTLVRWESAIIAFFGTALGLGVGVFVSWAMVRALAEEGINTFVVPPEWLVVSVIGAAVVAVVASVFPAHRAGRLDVLSSITGD